jgi:hypothetical protein
VEDMERSLFGGYLASSSVSLAISVAASEEEGEMEER